MTGRQRRDLQARHRALVEEACALYGRTVDESRQFTRAELFTFTRLNRDAMEIEQELALLRSRVARAGGRIVERHAEALGKLADG